MVWGFRVRGFRVQGLYSLGFIGFRVWGLGFIVWGLGLRVENRCRVHVGTGVGAHLRFYRSRYWTGTGLGFGWQFMVSETLKIKKTNYFQTLLTRDLNPKP